MHFTTLSVAALGALAQISSALPPPGHSIHEKREVTSSRWVKRDRLPSDARLPIRIGLSQSNLDQAHKYLMDVSDPKSKNYAKHWTQEEVIAKFAPSKEAVEATREWLVKSGISGHRISHSDNRGWLAFDATTKEMEDLLDTEFHAYDHETQGSTVGCDEYSLPNHVRRHVDFVSPGIKLAPSGGSAKRNAKRNEKRGVRQNLRKDTGRKGSASYSVSPIPNSNTTDLSTCDKIITPECIRALYDVPPANLSDPSNSMGIFETGAAYAQKDMDLFYSRYAPQIPNGTHPKHNLIDGATAPSVPRQASGEADLDFQLAYSLIYPQGTTLFQADDQYVTSAFTYGNGLFNTFLDAIDGTYCNYTAFNITGDSSGIDPTYPDERPGGYNGTLQCGVFQPTNVISISYGVQEHDLPAAYQRRQCTEFLKLGLQGVTVVVASGDDGVEGRLGDESKGANRGCLGPEHKVYNPTYPATCPYLTTVGATMVFPNKTVNDPESAAYDDDLRKWSQLFSSGGGFSNIYPIPDYQAPAVATYLNNWNPGYPTYGLSQSMGANGGIYNNQGRGFPDVAAVGNNIASFVGTNFFNNGGTSASAPIFASLINLINEERIAAGKNPVGFVNPTLYANPQAMNDITNGTNPGCNTTGFAAVEGWDPVTGLGTPNYPKLLSVFMGLN
ncbi:MAG: hypothetical protein LQ340_007523 [Diploschistes diacapsis]|nr:MAG: hypothetical protein LQ340_007523 [Diploschistes diacapsis]